MKKYYSIIYKHERFKISQNEIVMFRGIILELVEICIIVVLNSYEAEAWNLIHLPPYFINKSIHEGNTEMKKILPWKIFNFAYLQFSTYNVPGYLTRYKSYKEYWIVFNIRNHYNWTQRCKLNSLMNLMKG